MSGFTEKPNPNIDRSRIRKPPAAILTPEQGRELLATKKVFGKRGSPESDLQCACVDWFRRAYPQYKKLLYAIPNGAKLMFAVDSKGNRYSPEAVKLKKEGLLEGMLDMGLAVMRKGFGGLFIEMKVGYRKLSPQQLEMIFELTAAGYLCIVCWTFDEFKKAVEGYLG